jgi:transcription elongation factor GreA
MVNYLTKEKHKELIEELNFLKIEKRKEIIESLEDAKAMGDLSENAEYHQAREDQATNESRILKLEEILKNYKILNHVHSDIVQVGCTVVLQKENNSEKITYDIVGSEDLNMLENKISLDSPLVQVMLGKKKDDVFNFKTPIGKIIKYKIVDIK